MLMKTLLFVCTGNTCRSPMAEALARRALADHPDWKVLSAGIGAINGQPPSSYSVDALHQIGVPLSGHTSKMLTGRLIRDADYIFGLTRSHVEGIALLYPEASEKLLSCVNSKKTSVISISMSTTLSVEACPSTSNAVTKSRQRWRLPSNSSCYPTLRLPLGS